MVEGRSVIVPGKPRWCCAQPTLKVGPISRSSGARLSAWLAMISGHSASAPVKPFGPCCSIEPMGITMVFDFFSQRSMSGQVETGRRMGSVLSRAEAAGDVAHLPPRAGFVLAVEGQCVMGPQARRAGKPRLPDQGDHPPLVQPGRK